MKATTHHLLNLDFLERAETTSARLHMQRAFDAVLHAFVFVLTVNYGSELLVRDLLEGL